jgi:uncharacterized protein YbcI
MCVRQEISLQGDGKPPGMDVMQDQQLTMPQRIAKSAGELEFKRTGMMPERVTATQNDGTLVITLYGALSPAERSLAKTAAGALQVKEFHRELFTSNAAELREAIKLITGVEVGEATSEVEPETGTVVTVFVTGTIVQVFLLKQAIPAETWNAAATNGF